MDKIAFARLIAYLATLTHHNFDEFEIKQIDAIMGTNFLPQAHAVRDMVGFMAEGKKIDAIRIFRALTGDTLKDSKEAVDRAMDKPSAIAA